MKEDVSSKIITSSCFRSSWALKSEVLFMPSFDSNDNPIVMTCQIVISVKVDYINIILL